MKIYFLTNFVLLQITVYFTCFRSSEELQQNQCPSLCPPGERSIVDRDGSTDCAKYADLHEPCEPGPFSLIRCQTAYSFCDNGVCRCLDGFQARNGHCHSAAIKCPGFPALPTSLMCTAVHNICEEQRKIPIATTPLPPPSTTPCAEGIIQPCLLPVLPPPTAGMEIDDGKDALIGRLDDSFSCVPSGASPIFKSTNKQSRTRSRSRSNKKKRHARGTVLNEARLDCPESHFCNIYAAYKIQDCTLIGHGHCCPHSCPLGHPHPTAKCDADAELKCNDQEGYFCRRSYLTEEALRAFGVNVDQNFLATCCPRHCPEGTIALNDGHCIHVGSWGEACWRDEQCPKTAVCREGMCQCAPTKQRMVGTHNHNGGFFCAKKRPGNLVRLGDQCFIGQQCEPDQSYCVGNRCQCICHYSDQGNSTCVKENKHLCPMDKPRTPCKRWASKNECDRNPDWMRVNCPRSCNSC